MARKSIENTPQNRNVLVFQVGKRKPEVVKDLSDEKSAEIIGKHNSGAAELIRAEIARIERIQNEVISDPDEAVDYYLLQKAQSRADEVFNLDLDGLKAAELVDRIDQYHRYSTIGSALLYDGKRFSGSTKFFTVTWPNFKWWPYRFNDRASSARAWGINVLFEHTWYRGRRLWLVGFPYVQFDDLGAFGFDNIASAYASLG